MNLSNFVERVNELSRSRTPFLFVIDFEMKKPFVCGLEDAAAENIFYDFRGMTNRNGSKWGNKIDLEKFPISFQHYQQKFDDVMGHLNYGHSFLTNLTIRTPVFMSSALKELFDRATAKYKLWFKDEFVVFSPETFITINNNIISAYPMKGTMDASIHDADKILLSNKKETAEHVTIVDLLRNDLSQVADHVKVVRFKYLEKIIARDKSLWQMSSEIAGELLPGYAATMGDLLIRLLPAGSVSGAPKNKTLEIIKETEIIPRGFYTGVFGYFNGTDLDSSVMIRFIEKTEGNLFYRSGGGITTQSSAQDEYQEAIDKIYVPVD